MLALIDGPALRCGWLPGRFRFPGHSLTLVAKGSFALRPDAPAVPAEEPLDLEGDRPFPGAPEGSSPAYDSDFAYWKPQADVLLVGACHPPGASARRCPVGLRVGSLSKRLEVVGDRRWWIPFGPLSPKTRPSSFDAMPLRWEQAAGGGRSKRNPVGKGRRRTRDADGRLVRPAPNLERPGRSALSPWWQGAPVGFGPLARSWRPRTRKLGTYRRRWRKTRWPWFPENFDWAHFNAAPPDQRVPYLRGDEEIELENLHPRHARLRSALPGWRVRAFLNVPEAGDGARRLQEVPLVLDTLWIDAEQERLVLVWRGVADVASAEFEEVEHALFFPEPLDAPPADAAEVERRFERALAEALGVLPIEEPGETPEQALAAFEAAHDAEIAGHMAALGDALEEAGLPRDYMDLPTPSYEERVAKAIEDARQRFGPERLADVVFPTAEALRAEEAAVLARLGLDFELPAFPEPPTRERVAARAAAGESLAGEDLQGLALAGLDLRGTDFAGADLQRADLSASDLSGAVLSGARLAGADLSGAVLRGTRLDGADLVGARLARADLASAVLDECTADRADLCDAELADASAASASFVGARLERSRWERGRLAGADFSKTQLDGASFASADLASASFEEASGEQVVFDGARLQGLRAGAASRLPGASFAGADASDSTWEGALLRGARFAGAVLARADFARADLGDADLARCQMPQARFDRALLQRARLGEANLFRGSLEGADLSDADLRGANLYEVETLDAVLAGAQLRGANLRMTKLA